ncbi:acetylglutamate kinase [Ochromonadaceae sp. CCMP2298]|nr:acetylglutamate kinase [Ochromonadaceae sp. CCMP2298]|mmetsp:Transcript_12743/g.28306  ORF Transcript_12743/g.28306 Transcript_12743/m.28306 type:complete len:307 (-) Transcript_12743:102-1022(-)
MMIFIALVLLQVAAAFRGLPVAPVARRLWGHAEDTAALLEGVTKTHPKGTVVVIKYGGHAMEDAALRDIFYADVAALYKSGLVPVLVHGGGPQIAQMLKTLNVPTQFVDGLRVTDKATMDVAQMVLCGSINKEISSSISRKGVQTVGLSGLDAGLILGRKKDPRLGLVGEPVSVNAPLLRSLLAAGLVPVIAPVGTDEDQGGALNINADTAAGAVAEALSADVFLLLTDIAGVLDKDKRLLQHIPASSLQALKADGTITGGMIPKLETAAQAVGAGVGEVAIMDGRVPHCILRALSGEVFGTKVSK